MVSQGTGVEAANSVASATSPDSFNATLANAASSLAVEAEVEASASSDGQSRLTDDILRQIIEERGDCDGRLPQEILATTPYNLTVSAEEVRRRVKKLLDEESAVKNKHTDLGNTKETMEEAATDTKEEDANAGEKQVDSSTEEEEAVARDLDMLADTVRSFVTDAEGLETSVDDEDTGVATVEDDVEPEDKTALIETTGDAAVTEEVATEGALPLDEDKPSADRVTKQDKEGLDVALPNANELVREVVKDVADEESAVAIPSSTTSDCSDALPTGATSSKRPAARSSTLKHAPKRQKRAEYSEETRALCVRRHRTEGASYATISKELGIPHDTVRAIVRKATRTGTVSSAPRSGRPRKTSGIIDKVILEAVRTNKQCSAKSIQQELLRLFGVKVSPETVRRRVIEHTKKRIQSISGGDSSDPAQLPTAEKDEAAAGIKEVVVEAPIAHSLDVSTAVGTSLSDSLSFQQLLHEEVQSTSEAVQGLESSVLAAFPNTEEELPEASISSFPSDGNDAETKYVPREDKPSPQKRPKRGEYSIETREQCVALHAQGQGYRRIGKSLSMPHTTVRAIVEKAHRTGTVLPAKRSGRPRKTDEIVDKVILQAVQANEKSSARMIKEQLLAAYGVIVSCETIRRRVKEHSRQCMLTSASATISESLPNPEADATLAHQHASHEEEMLAPTGPSEMQAASLITFDENGVHL